MTPAEERARAAVLRELGGSRALLSVRGGALVVTAAVESRVEERPPGGGRVVRVLCADLLEIGLPPVLGRREAREVAARVVAFLAEHYPGLLYDAASGGAVPLRRPGPVARTTKP